MVRRNHSAIQRVQITGRDLLAEVIPVAFTGVLPDLFSEGQGMIGTGQMVGGVFEASEILAKHDETYMPKEVMDALKDFKGPGNIALVTHQVNITGLTSIVPRSGELVFATLDAGGAVSVIGRQSAGA